MRVSHSNARNKTGLQHSSNPVFCFNNKNFFKYFIKIKYTFDGFVELVFYKNKVSDGILNDTLKNKEIDILNPKGKNRDKILDIIKADPKITKKDLVQKLNMSISGIEKIFRQLKKEKIIERIGSDKQGIWKIKK